MNAAVAELGYAPGKSMRACEDIMSIEIGEMGVNGDRSYMWVEAAPHTNIRYHRGQIASEGQFLSQREDPHLANIVPTLSSVGITLTWQNKDGLLVPRTEDTCTDRIPVSVHIWEGQGVDQGDLAAQWGEEYIGRPVRLVAVSDVKPRFVEGNPVLGRVGFSDGYPITVGSTVAYSIINGYLESIGEEPLPTDRSRTTILLDGLRDLGEGKFPEDYIKEIYVASNGLSAVLKRRKACGRCPVPDTNQKTGERNRHKLLFTKALKALGRKGAHVDTERYGTKLENFFTQNFVIELPPDMPVGEVITISRSDVVEVTYSDDPNWVRAA